MTLSPQLFDLLNVFSIREKLTVIDFLSLELSAAAFLP
jgi:hypothetical protein